MLESHCRRRGELMAPVAEGMPMARKLFREGSVSLNSVKKLSGRRSQFESVLGSSDGRRCKPI